MSDPFEETEIGRLLNSYDDAWQDIADLSVDAANWPDKVAEKAAYNLHQKMRAALIAKLKEMQERLEYAEKDVACRQGNADHNYALLCEVKDQLAAKDAALKLCVEALINARQLLSVFVEPDDAVLYSVKNSLAAAEKAGGGNV